MRSYGVAYLSGVESNFGVAKNFILCILWSGVLERSCGVEYWSGVESNFGVACHMVKELWAFLLSTTSRTNAQHTKHN